MPKPSITRPAPLGTHEDFRVRRNLLAEDRRAGNRRELFIALARAEDQERRALAKDLHDDLGQMLAVVALKVWTIKKSNTSEELRPAIEDCTKAVALANDKLQSMALQLTPPLVDERGLAPMLVWLADEMQRTYTIEVELIDDGLPMAMDTVVASFLCRAVRELLLNVIQHAGVARASIETRRGNGNTAIVQVGDTGVGFDCESIGTVNQSGRFGLFVTRKRLGFLGGTLSIRSSPGLGTLVTMQVPLLMVDTTSSMKDVPQ